MKRLHATRFGALPVLCVGITLSAAAADPAMPAVAAPAGARADVAAASPAQNAASLGVAPYASDLEAYRRYRTDEPMRDWREVNDEVGRLGGFMGHFQPADKQDAPR